jgi:selenocysteine-specific elongation factor
VQSLTGVDPDRLPEEKDRGLTIDLGFAPLILPDGRRVGVIDVPGHERLVKNMVAGATGIDFVLLIVAADDGVMPQTREHLTIMQVLGIQQGLVVITKIDLVDEDLRALVREEVEEVLRGTFLEKAPIFEASSVTGEGLEALKKALFGALTRIQPRSAGGVFRMPIQRVFSPKGFGTVVTGVPVSGTTRAGDTMEVVPLGQKGRVRGIQAYKEATDIARAGHSTAINLSDVDYRSIHRGMALAEPGYFEGSKMFEARFLYLPDTRKPLFHQSSIRLHTGTTEALGKIHLLEKKKIEPGEESFVQFRLEEPIVTAPGDRYVLRLYSPMETIGGGEILARSRWRLKTGKTYVLDRLRKEESALHDLRRQLVHLVEEAGYDTVPKKDLPAKAGRPPGEIQETLDDLIEEGLILPSQRAGQLVSASQLSKAGETSREIAAAFFRKNPRRSLMDKAVLKQSLQASDLFLQDLLPRLEESGDIQEMRGSHIRWRDFGPRLSHAEKEICEEILGELLRKPWTPPSPGELAETRGWDPEVTAELFDLLSEQDEVQKTAESIYFHSRAVEDARDRLGEHLKQKGAMTAAEAREILASTRKYIIPLLEHLDREGFTYRKGDIRKLKSE